MNSGRKRGEAIPKGTQFNETNDHDLVTNWRKTGQAAEMDRRSRGFLLYYYFNKRQEFFFSSIKTYMNE